ncbi:MAG: glycosyltransferase family 39 protein [Planctomycetes bacterium]|nr:glycosyltransferase family 39 protein [Planctomycetota bacterium]
MSSPAWLLEPPAPDTLRRGRRWLWLCLLVWVLVMQFGIAPHGIGGSWRECDTQAIARNFLRDGFDLLHPRVDWRGATDGSVESEFPLYQALLAGALLLFGDVDWPGRVLSLLAMVAATLALHRLLEWRAGPAGALAAAIVFLSGGHAFLLGERVIPDALSLALALASLPPFLRYLATGRLLPLLAASVALTLGALQKPPALQLGLVMFLWTWQLRRQRLREFRLWLCWLAIVGIVAAWIAHAASIGATTGLTFGIVHGDTKFPGLRHLIGPKIETELLLTTLTFGFSLFGFAALLALWRQRRLERSDLALLLPVAIGLFASLRYSHSRTIGPHYHVFAAVAGAWCVARAWQDRAPRWLWIALIGAATLQGTGSLLRERDECRQHRDWPLLPVAQALRAASQPDDRIIVCSPKPEFDPLWRRRTNFEDPRIFFQAQRNGWAVPIDRFTPARVQELHDAGARWLIVPAAVAAVADQAITSWLRQNATVSTALPGGTVYRL